MLREGRWDLHMHSVWSDGHDTPEELVGMAKEAGLVGIAITDIRYEKNKIKVYVRL